MKDRGKRKAQPQDQGEGKRARVDLDANFSSDVCCVCFGGEAFMVCSLITATGGIAGVSAGGSFVAGCVVLGGWCGGVAGYGVVVAGVGVLVIRNDRAHASPRWHQLHSHQARDLGG